MPEKSPGPRSRAAGCAVSPDLAQLQPSIDRASRLLRAMANPVRLLILCRLSEGEQSVTALEEAVGISQSGVSQHLALMRRQGLVAARREGLSVYYQLASSEVVALMHTLHALFCPEPAKGKGKAATRRATH
jgi:ArsR family transcriptional regulator